MLFRTTFQGLALVSLYPSCIFALILSAPFTLDSSNNLIVRWVVDSGDPLDLDIDVLCDVVSRRAEDIETSNRHASIPLPDLPEGIYDCIVQATDSGDSRFPLASHSFKLRVSGPVSSTTIPACPIENRAEIFFTTTTTTITTTTRGSTRTICIPQSQSIPTSVTSIPTSINSQEPRTSTTRPSATSSTNPITPTPIANSISSIPSSTLLLKPSPSPSSPVLAPAPRTRNRDAIIGGTVGSLGTLAIIIGLGFAFRKYRKYRLASRSIQFTGIHEVKMSVGLASLLSNHFRSFRRQLSFPLSQGDSPSSPINDHNADRPFANAGPGAIETSAGGGENQQEARLEVEAARQQREIFESDMEERLSRRESDDAGRRYPEVEQRLRDGIERMSRRIAQLEEELATERQVVGLPPPGYVSIGGSESRL